ncbi:EF-hand domain-containing protein [Salinicola endophyticus]|uniref:EF-hand domain-containing protein n=1 Tax=Salinicola endophyticus TaxID=1949083 RepID=A0AB74U7J2_9GAMM
MANDSPLQVTLTADARPLTGVLRDSAQALGAFADDAERSGQRFAAAMAQSARPLETVNGHLQRLEALGRVAGGQLAALGRAGVGGLRDQAKQLAETESLAQALGLSATRLQEWQYAGQQVGLQASQVGEIFTRLQTTLGELGAGAGTSDAAGVFAQLNLDLRELQSLAPDAQLQRIGEAIARLDDPAQRTRAFETLAEGASRLNPLLQAGGLRLRTYRDEAQHLGVALSSLELADAAQADRALRQVGAAVEGLANQLLVALGPGLATAADGLSGLIRDAGGMRAVFDGLVTTGQVLASLYAGHLAQSLATYATGALAANGASITLTGTLRILRSVMATAFGPLGVVVAAAGVLYTFREELGLVPTYAKDAADEVDLLTGSIEGLSRAQLENKKVGIVANLVQAQTEAATLQKQIDDLQKKARSESIQFQGRPGAAAAQLSGVSGIGGLTGELKKRQAAIEANQTALDQVNQAIAKFGEASNAATPPANQLNTEIDDGATAARAQANALQALEDRLDPVAASQRAFQTDTQTLNRSVAMGAITFDRYFDLVDKLQHAYRNSGDAAKDASQAAKTATHETSVLSRTLDQMVAGLDDTFQGFWARMLGGAKVSFEGLKSQAISTLAEIIHAYTTKRIVASLGLSVGGSLAGTGSAVASGTGGGFGGSGLDLASLGKNLYQGVTDGFASIQWTGVPTGATAYTSGFGSQVATGGGMFGGSFQNFTGWNGMASLAAAYAGTQVGNKLGSSLFGKQANSNLGATIGGGVGTFFGGSLGAFAGSTLGGMVDSLFGSSRKYKAGLVSYAETPDGPVQDRYYDSGNRKRLVGGRESAFGSFGLTHKTKFDVDPLADFLDALQALDNTIATGASAKQIDAVKQSLDGFYTSVSNDPLTDMLTDRMAVIKAALLDSSSDVGDTLIERVGDITAKNAEKLAPKLAQALQLGNLIDGLSDSVRGYAVGVVSDTRRSMEDALAQITAGVAAHAAVSAIADQLNLSFDAMGERAVEAALNLQQLAGGLDNLQSQAQRYYANFFSEQEREQRAIAQLTPTLHRAGLSAYSTREQFRAVVESLDLNTAAGRQTYSELMGIADAFAAISAPVQATTQSLQDLQAAARSQVETAKDAVRQAYQTFAGQAFDQRITLLKLAGREQAALSLQRQQELQTLDASLRPIQQRIWALQDEQAALADARQASDDYRSALAQASSQLAQTLGGISSWIDQQQASGGSPGSDLQAAQAQFARQLVRAQGGDRDALGGLTQYAERYQQAGAAYYGSGTGYQRIRDEILDALGELPDQVSAEQYVAEEIKAALASAVDQLPGGIASALDPLFAALDTNLDGLLTFGELQTGLQGIASDAQIRSLIQQLDSDGDGQISALEAIKGATDRVDGNTGTLESRALDQLRQLTELSAEMTRTTDQFITLNTTMQSLQEALVALGLAQQQAAEIEARRRAAEAAEKQRIAQERARTLAEQRKTLQGEVRSLQATYDGYQKVIAFNQNPNMRTGLTGQYLNHSNVRRGASSLDDLLSGHYDYRYRTNLPTSQRVRALLKDYNEAMQNSDSVAQQLAVLKQSLDRLPTYNIGGAFGGAEIITQPTLFNTALMGEAGPEAIMPLSRGADGSLGVRLDGAPAPVGGQGGGHGSAELAPLLQRLAQLTAENTELLRRIEAHEGAGVRVAQAGHQRSIDQLTRIAESNQALDDRARLEALA